MLAAFGRRNTNTMLKFGHMFGASSRPAIYGRPVAGASLHHAAVHPAHPVPSITRAARWLQGPPLPKGLKKDHAHPSVPGLAGLSAQAGGSDAASAVDTPTDGAEAAVAIDFDSPGAGMKQERKKGERRRGPKKGMDLELDCTGLAFRGKGVCKMEDGFVVLVDRALPGERVLARVQKSRSGYAEARKIESLSTHDHAVEPRCEHFGPCGGCKLQNLEYSIAAGHKYSQVAELMARVGAFGDPARYMKPIIECSEQFNYRNKMEFSYATQEWTDKAPMKRWEMEQAGIPIPERTERGYVLGLHSPGRFDKVLRINKCHLQHDIGNGILALVGRRAKEMGLEAYDPLKHDGWLRHLMIRKGSDGKGNPTFMVNFITKTHEAGVLDPLVAEVVAAHPEVISVVNNVAPGLGPQCTDEHVLFGPSVITETLRGVEFEISAKSFFQTNTHQAEVLYEAVEEACGLKGDQSEVLLDLFCGTGSIGLSLARHVKEVWGWELVPEAVADAERNARHNNITNAQFRQGDLSKLSSEIGEIIPTPDVVITDPNRPGMNDKLINWLRVCGARRIVYVSCNPATQARDLQMLMAPLEGGGGGGPPYQLMSVQPVDMFPHTPHCESIAVLDRT